MMGLEPTTFCMASRRSSQLSYIREVAAVYRPFRAGSIGRGRCPGRMLRAADVDGVIEALQALADPERAALVRPYLGAAAGDHADGDEILGCRCPHSAAPPGRRHRPAPARRSGPSSCASTSATARA